MFYLMMFYFFCTINSSFNFSSLFFCYLKKTTFELFASEKKQRNFWDLTISEEKLFMSTSGLYVTHNICFTSDFDVLLPL